MSERLHSHSEVHPRFRVGEPRARSLPFRKPFVIAGLFSAIHFLALLAWLTCIVLFFLDRTEVASNLVVGSIVMVVVTWLIAFFQRRSVRCPLCKGTPLLNSGALPHGKAFRIPPLSHGLTATLSLIFTQEYRCMYCGNVYDLLKPTAPDKRPNLPKA